MDAEDVSSCDHSVDQASSSQFGMDGDRAEGGAFLRKTEIDPEKKPTLDELLEMVLQLRESHEKQNKLVKRQAKEIKKLKKSHIRFSNNVKYIFGNQWEEKMQEWKEKMEKLRKEETELEGTLEGLKKLVREIGGKEDEILKLKKKLVQLEQGKNRESTSNVNVEDGKEVCKLERKDAVELPPEVWKIIFGNVSDPNDLWNCSNTRRSFEELLRDWRTSWVFQPALPYFYGYLSGQTLLKCRTICRGWRTAVDSLLEDHPSLRPHTERLDPRKLEFLNPLNETRVSRENEFTFYFDGGVSPDIPDFPSKNVFVGRNVVMNIGEEYYEPNPGHRGDPGNGGAQQLWDRVIQFLSKFGKEIWYLAIVFPINRWEPFEREGAEQKVVEFFTSTLFSLAPNLRKLCIEDVPPAEDIDVLQMQHAISANKPMHLETFEANFEDYREHYAGTPPKIITSLFSECRTQLRRLHLRADLWGDVCSLGWPNLSELHLSDFQYFDGFDACGLPVRKDRLGCLRWEGMPQLRKFGVKIKLHSLKDYAKFLADLHKITSVTRLDVLCLDLELDGVSYWKWDDEVVQVLETNSNLFVSPTLRTIEVNHSYGMAEWARAYNFLLRFFPLIENLHVFETTRNYRWGPLRAEINQPFNWSRRLEEFGRYKRGEELVEINKYAYDGEMYRSNIWELLPRLEVFTFQCDVYTRKGYEDYIQRRSRCESSTLSLSLT